MPLIITSLTPVMPGLIGQSSDHYLPQPRDQLGLGCAEELPEFPVCFQEGFLDQVGRVEPDPQRLADHGAGYYPQVVAV